MPSPTSLSQVRADAIARRDRGDLHSARDLLERALEAAIMTSGEDHPEVLTTAHLLASLHRQTGDLSGARRVLENALYAGGSRHGDDHPILLAISFDLAEIADELGNRHEARKHYTRVAKFGPAAPGFNQQQVQAARAWLGPNAPAAAGVQGQTVHLPGPEPLTVVSPPIVTPPVEWPPKTTPPPPATPTLTPTSPAPAGQRAEPLPEAPTQSLQPAPPQQQPASPAPQGVAPTPAVTQRPPAQPAPPQGPPQQQSRPPQGPPQQGPPQQQVRPPQGPPQHAPLQQGPPQQSQQGPPRHAQPPQQPVPQQQPVNPGYPGTPMRPAPVEPTSGQPGGRLGPYPPSYGPQPAMPAPPPYPQKKGRGALVASILAAVIAITAAAVTVYFALLRPDGPTTPDRLAATNVAIDVRDDRVTISWTDPSNGQAQPIIVGNREGEGLRRFALPARGATTQPITGLNKNFDYCFNVLLDYVDTVTQSEQVCTNRKKATPTPSR